MEHFQSGNKKLKHSPPLKAFPKGSSLNFFFFAPKSSVLNNLGLPVVGKAKSSALHTLIIVSTSQKNDPDHERGEGSEHQLWHTKNMLKLTDKKNQLE